MIDPAEEVLSYMIRAHDLATPVFREFGAQVAATTKQVQGSLLELNRTLAAQAGEAKRLGGAQRSLTGETMAYQQAVGRTGSAAGAMGRDVRGATTELERHHAAIQQAAYGLSGFAGQLGPLGRSMDMAGRHASLFRSQGIDYVAAGLVGLSATAVAYSVKTASSFEQMTKSMQQQTGATRVEAQKLMAVVQEVGTKTPASWQQITQAVGTQYRLFGDNAKAIKQNTDLFMAFADQAGRGVTPTITDLSNVMRQMHPAGMNVVDVMDQLTNLAQKTQRPLGQYLGVISRFAPFLSAMGLSFTQLIGLFKAFSDHGITATQMGRGLFTAMSQAQKQIKLTQKATADGGLEFKNMQGAIQGTQMRIDVLVAKIKQHGYETETERGTLMKLQQTLESQKLKYQQLTQQVQQAGGAHATVTGILTQEFKAIENAKTKQDALSLSMQTFGRLGPAMAGALWKNKQGLDALDQSLGSAHGKTEDLAKAQRDSLHGQLIILEHDFSLIAKSVGEVAVPPLKTMAHVLEEVAKAVAGLPKPLLDALVFGGMGAGAATLISRHTPIGSALAQGPLSHAPQWVKDTIGGGRYQSAMSQAGALTGYMGSPLRPGMMSNPLAVTMVGGMQPGVSRGVGAAAGDAAMAEQPMVAREGKAIPGQGSLFGSEFGAAAAPGEQMLLGAEGGVGASAALREAEKTGLLSKLKGLGGSLIGRAGTGLLIGGGGAVASQIVGGLVGGQAGKTVSSIGTDASLGAGLGMLAGPEGAVIGGIGGALIGGITNLFHSKSFEQKFAESFGHSSLIGAPRNAAQAQAIQQSTDFATQAARVLRQGTDLSKVVGVNRQTGQPIYRTSDPAQQTADFQRAGVLGASSLQAQLGSFAHIDPQSVIDTFVKKFDRGDIPARMKDAGAKQILAWAQSMEANGQLPKHAVDLIRVGIEARMSGIRTDFQNIGLTSTKALADSLKNDQVTKSVQATIDNVKTQWSSMPALAKNTGANIVSNMAVEMKYLHEQVMTAQTAGAKKDALAQLKQLKDGAQQYFSTMVQTASQNFKDLSGAIKSNTGDAAKSATANFNQLAGSVEGAMHSGVMSTKQGAKLIGEALNAMLKAFGEKPVNIVGLTSGELANFSPQTYLGGAGTTSVHAGGLERGGLFQFGQAGRQGQDNIPVNFGGVPIVVGSGEVGAVLTGQQQRVANNFLSPIGGLPGLFSKVNSPHSSGYARGGVVTASQFGGPGDPGTGSTGYRGDNLYQHPDSFAELNMGTALGGLPYMAPISLTYSGKTARLFKRDIGAGGSGLHGHTRAVDIWFQAAQQLGFPGLADVMVDGGQGVNLKIGGGGGSASQIAAPHLTGHGTIASIARTVLAKGAQAANDYLARVAPSANVGISGGPLPGGKVVGPGKAAYAAVLPVSRTDQGLDFTGSGPFGAILDGTVIRDTLWPGWPGTGGVVYNTSKGNVYAMEHVQPLVHVGQHVKAGQIIGNVLQGYPWLETGWANSAGTGPATPYNGAADGTAMPGGVAFRRYLGYNRGGGVGRKMDFAGAFGSGGTVVANQPTAAIFGDKGTETAIFLPGAINDAMAVTASAVGPGGAVTGVPQVTVAPPKAKQPHTSHPSARYVNHVYVGTFTQAEWEAYQRAHPKLKAAHHHALPSVSEPVDILGQGVGDITSKSRVPIEIPRDLGKLADATWKKVLAAVTKHLSGATGPEGAMSDVRLTGLLASSHVKGKTAKGHLQELTAAAIQKSAANVLKAASDVPDALAGTADQHALTQLRKLIADARRSGNKSLVDGLQKNLQTVANNWLQSVTNAAQAKQDATKGFYSIKGLEEQNKYLTQHPGGNVNLDATYFAIQNSGLVEDMRNLGQEKGQLAKALKEARRQHNAALVSAIKSQLQGVDQAIAQDQLDQTTLAQTFWSGITDATQQALKAIYDGAISFYQSVASYFGQLSSNAGTIASIQGYSQNIHGTSDSQLSTLKNNQGGVLTPTQIAQANQNLGDFVSGVHSQETPLSGGLSHASIMQLIDNPMAVFSDLGDFLNTAGTGSALGIDISGYQKATAAGDTATASQFMTAILGLISQLGSLESSITDQTKATTDLTSATNTATNTQTFGGSVGFSYGGENQVTQTSVSPLDFNQL